MCTCGRCKKWLRGSGGARARTGVRARVNNGGCHRAQLCSKQRESSSRFSMAALQSSPSFSGSGKAPSPKVCSSLGQPRCGEWERAVGKAEHGWVLEEEMP